jgi:hypothetical protein
MYCETGSILNREPIKCRYYTFNKFIRNGNTETIAFCSSVWEIASSFDNYYICDLAGKDVIACSDYEPIIKKKQSKPKVIQKPAEMEQKETKK